MVITGCCLDLIAKCVDECFDVVVKLHKLGGRDLQVPIT